MATLRAHVVQLLAAALRRCGSVTASAEKLDTDILVLRRNAHISEALHSPTAKFSRVAIRRLLHFLSGNAVRCGKIGPQLPQSGLAELGPGH